MKKILFLLLFLLVGCGKEETIIHYDNYNYQVASPYKESVGNYSLKSYDINNLENHLMNISLDYFKVNNTLYQNGQYLNNDDIKNLLNKFNQESNKIISIYEQDYLSMDNKLKGLSIAVVIEDDLDYALSKINQLVEFIRSKDELKQTKLLIGIYQTSYFKGSIKYLGFTDGNSIKMNNVNYNYQIIDSSYVIKNDSKTYNTILNIKNSLDNKDIYVNAYGLYKDKDLQELYITLNKDYYTKPEILDITKIINSNLNVDKKTNVYFKSNKINGFINEKKELYIMED